MSKDIAWQKGHNVTRKTEYFNVALRVTERGRKDSLKIIAISWQSRVISTAFLTLDFIVISQREYFIYFLRYDVNIPDTYAYGWVILQLGEWKIFRSDWDTEKVAADRRTETNAILWAHPVVHESLSRIGQEINRWIAYTRWFTAGRLRITNTMNGRARASIGLSLDNKLPLVYLG